MKKYLPRRYEGAPFDDQHIYRPIIGLDIDGTLGEYHEHFWRFAVAWTGRDLPHPRDFTGGSFAAFLGLAKSTYRKIKLAYRRGGAKRSMPVFDGAPELARSLRDRGAVVALCTTRPYLSLEGIDEDTRHWASRNRVSHDFILWGEHKYRDLSRFGERVVAVLEDEPSLIRQAQDVGIEVMVRTRPYNQDVELQDEPLRIWRSGIEGSRQVLHDWLDEWEGKYR